MLTRWLPAVAAGLVPFALYVATMAPSITWRGGGTDSGDVATGAAVLGILHPPGYALFVVLGYLAAKAMPWVEPARAVTLLGAGMVACAAAVVYVTCLRWSGDRLASLIAAWALALGTLWWQQATYRTVHALNVFFAAVLCLYAVTASRRELSSREWALAALVCGLAITDHLTLAAIPAAFVLSRVVLRSPRPVPPGMVAAFAIGLTRWAVLPLIAATRPPHLWEDPTTLGGFLDLVLASRYQEYLTYPTPLGVVYRVAFGIWTMAKEVGPLGFVFGVAGFALLWDSARRYVLFVLILTALLLAFFARYAARDVESYLLPGCIALAPAIADAASGAIRLVGARWPARATVFAAGLAAATPAAGIALAWNTVDLSDDRAAIDYTNALLAEAPQNAVVLTESDQQTFALWYGRLALRQRADVAHLDVGMLEWPWYREHVRRQFHDVRIGDSVPTGADWASGAITSRPVTATRGDDSWGVPVQRGRLFHRLTA